MVVGSIQREVKMCDICKGGGCSICFRTESNGPQFASGKEIEEFFDNYSESIYVDPAEQELVSE